MNISIVRGGEINVQTTPKIGFLLNLAKFQNHFRDLSYHDDDDAPL